MKRFDACDVTLRYLTAERWQARDEHVHMGTAPITDPLIGFQDDIDAHHFRDAMRERVQAFSPPVRTTTSAELLRGVLKDLAQLHGVDGHEVAHEASDNGRSRPVNSGWTMAKAAGTALTSVGRALQPRTGGGTGFFMTRHHISEA